MKKVYIVKLTNGKLICLHSNSFKEITSYLKYKYRLCDIDLENTSKLNKNLDMGYIKYALQ